VCVKCGAATVRAARNGIELSDHSARTRLRPNLPPDFRGAVRLAPADLWAYACITCGYVELFVLDPEGLAFIAQQWSPVPAAPPAPPDPLAPPAPPDPTG
jgi:hypothetical protein